MSLGPYTRNWWLLLLHISKLLTNQRHTTAIHSTVNAGICRRPGHDVTRWVLTSALLCPLPHGLGKLTLLISHHTQSLSLGKFFSEQLPI